MDCALQLSSGALWADSDSVYWLDPASATVQGYLQQVCKELSSLGFTEVVFDDFYFPTSGNIAYESSQTKAEIIQDAATALRNAFAASNLHISFCVQDAAAALTASPGGCTSPASGVRTWRPLPPRRRKASRSLRPSWCF